MTAARREGITAGAGITSETFYVRARGRVRQISGIVRQRGNIRKMDIQITIDIDLK